MEIVSGDILKLDMKFIQSETAKPNKQGILRFIMGLARWMKLSVVAEGVETKEQADILKEMGLPFYDPLLIIEKTDGRMAGDEQWILILKNKEARHGTDPS